MEKKVAGFPNSTEQTKSWAKQGTLLPFLVESQLNKNGALAQNKQTLKNKHEVVIDQRIVSTMFLPSAALVAKEMIMLKLMLQKSWYFQIQEKPSLYCLYVIAMLGFFLLFAPLFHRFY